MLNVPLFEQWKHVIPEYRRLQIIICLKIGQLRDEKREEILSLCNEMDEAGSSSKLLRNYRGLEYWESIPFVCREWYCTGNRNAVEV